MILDRHGIKEFIVALEECLRGEKIPKTILVISPFYTHSAGNQMLILLASSGVEIRVLVQQEAWSKNALTIAAGRTYSVDQALLINLKNVGRNVKIRTLPDLHAKIFCIRYTDGSMEMWNGSANFTIRADGTLVGRRNPPSIEYIQRSTMIPSLAAEIHACWTAGVYI